MLRYYAERCGIDCIALRFPLLHYSEDRVRVSSGQERPNDILEGFTGLSYEDAARLFLAVVRTDLPGYRVYMPGVAHRHRDLARRTHPRPLSRRSRHHTGPHRRLHHHRGDRLAAEPCPGLVWPFVAAAVGNPEESAP